MLPVVGEAVGEDRAELVWAPLARDEDVKRAEPSSSEEPSASAVGPGAEESSASLSPNPYGAYLRRWSAADLEYEALHALWSAGGDAAAAELAMKEEHAEEGPARTLAQVRPIFGLL